MTWGFQGDAVISDAAATAAVDVAVGAFFNPLIYV